MIIRAEFVPIESRRLVTLDLDPEDLGGDVVRTEDVWPDSIVRVRYTATREQQSFIDTANIRKEVLAAGASSVTIQPEIVRADRARVEGLDEGVSELDALELWLETNTVEAGLADRMREKTREYLEAVA